MADAAFRVPRSTCRLFGTIKALATVQEALILVHGPKGCVYHINYILGMRGDRPSEIFSTCLDEHDVIFGAGEKLTRAIEELDRTRRPATIFVLSCCASGIIGEDVAAAVGSADIRSRAIAIESGGFEGDHAGGMSDCLSELARNLASGTGQPLPCTVNLVGMLRPGPDLAEIRDLLARAGVRINAVLPAGLKSAQIARIGDAALNVVICETSGLGAAAVLRERFGTPWVVTRFPIGYRATDEFLGAICRALQIAPGGTCGGPHPVTPEIPPGLRIGLAGGPTRAVALSEFLADLGCPPKLIVLDLPPPSLDPIREAGGRECRILIEPESGEIRDALSGQGIGLILGGMLERPYAHQLGIRHIDVMHGSRLTAGYRGAHHLAGLIAGKGEP